MRRIHYFQRFSKREDVVTNNTLLLLSRLQHHDFRILEDVLQELPGLDDLAVGASITQQESAPSRRIADGILRQRSFHLVVETKLGPSFDIEQLTGHLSQFEDSAEDVQSLVLLAPAPPVELSQAEARVRDFNRRTGRCVRVTWSTFENLIEKVRDAIPEDDRSLVDMIEDYEAFCEESGLLASTDAEMLVVGCSRSLQDNIDLSLYYDLKRPGRAAKYIGFYSDKVVTAIGRLGKVVRIDRVDGAFRIADDQPMTADELSRVGRAMNSADRHGWQIESNHYFFFAEELQPTAYSKQTKYPLRGRRYLDLRSALGKPRPAALPSLGDMAEMLRARSWA